MKKISGFTLIELLVVIAIIAILTAIVTANFTDAKKKSRDAKRVSDIAQIQLTLEFVFDKCNTYPRTEFLYDMDRDVCPGFPLGSFISVMPKDPNDSKYDYEAPLSNGTASYDYILRAELESYSSVLDDDVDPTVSIPIAGGCLDATSPYYYCVQPK